MQMNRSKIAIWCMSCCLFVLCSCSTPKNVTYVQDAEHGSVYEPEVNNIRVQPGDKLSIVINSKDPILSDLFNLPIISHRVGTGDVSTSLGSTQYVSYYTVSPDGDIDFPVLGKLHVAGLQRHELANYIKEKLISQDLVKDPVVTVEYVNMAVSVMGEVNHPGRYDINRDKVTIFDALSMAGDMTINGLRENVLVIRNVDGKQQMYRIDMTDTDNLYASPVYYLQQNDVVYVEPNNMKKRSATVNGNNVLSASFWVSIASLMTSIAVLIFK